MKKLAGQLGLQQNLFDQSLDSGKYAAQVQQDIADGRAMGVTGTPSFFINGRALSGAQPFLQFQKIIDEELNRASVK